MTLLFTGTESYSTCYILLWPSVSHQIFFCFICCFIWERYIYQLCQHTCTLTHIHQGEVHNVFLRWSTLVTWCVSVGRMCIFFKLLFLFLFVVYFLSSPPLHRCSFITTYRTENRGIFLLIYFKSRSDVLFLLLPQFVWSMVAW